MLMWRRGDPGNEAPTGLASKPLHHTRVMQDGMRQGSSVRVRWSRVSGVTGPYPIH